MPLDEHLNLNALAEWWENKQAERKRRKQEHEEHRRSPEYVGQLQRLVRLTQGAIDLLHMSHVAMSRMPNATDTYLMYAGTDDSLECLVAIKALVEQGVHNVARRECRYLLEQAVKYLYVDQQLPSLSATRDHRVEYLKASVPRSSIQPVFDIQPLLPSQDVQAFRNDVKGRWSSLSGVVHPSKEQIDERAARARRGSFSGFETAKDLTAINNQLASVYDCLGVIWLTAAGPSAAGDVIVELDCDSWIFRKSKWLQKLSRSYDYKLERQQGS
ncbi:hypothetical protein [Streptomyces lomondensis]|uniref:Uncharacterized protein n=1 Tax=Streptomyces lomondensis TaxID=68229 RepID=A0ABQ2WVV2_9ACTN|nr:hypothetical protein [Streptomyces lomondensis]MCF0078726.1 hypothetical protein [Streptomyces lomondensis]GGW79579.1 hypothetical protein GCM10010383_03960 [Streptomyces lomondensis]